MMSETLRQLFVMLLGCSLALSLAWFIPVLVIGGRRGGLSRTMVLLAIVEYLVFFAGFAMLLLLPTAGPQQRNWLLVGCLGGLAFMFFLLHVSLLLAWKAGPRSHDVKGQALPSRN
jgi:hypothetical protein